MYGSLRIIRGTLAVSVQGYAYNNQPGTSDKLEVFDPVTLSSTSSTLYVPNYGTLVKQDYWKVIVSSDPLVGDFSSKSTNPQANMTYGPPNGPDPGVYRITFNG